MEYKLTFENGSEALMHHGTKGMKWGVWNAETAARRMGSAKDQRAVRKEERGYAKYQKAKRKAEMAADNFVRNPSTSNRVALQNAVTKETRQNSQAYKDYVNKTTISYALGGPIGMAAYSSLSKKQKQRADLATAHVQETLATRIDDAVIKAKKETGMKAVDKVIQTSAHAKAMSKEYEEKARNRNIGGSSKS